MTSNQAKTMDLINQYIDTHKEELFQHIQQAVRIKSVVGHEQEIQQFMKRLYEKIGLEVVEVIPDEKKLSTHEAFVDSGFPLKDRRNIIGLLQGSDQGKSLTLHGHVDVVSEGVTEAWTKDPFGGEIEGNRLYGRGALDMKSGVIANWFALKCLIDLGIELKGTVQLHSTIEEEAGGGLGALACLEEGYITDGYVTTEPHHGNVCIAHAGLMYFRVRVFGKTAHAARTQDGVNAISKMYKIFNAIEALDLRRAEEVTYDLFHKVSNRSTNISIGTIDAGDWVSSVAGEAVIEGRFGFVPGETRKEMKALLETTVQEASKDDPWLQKYPPEIEWFGWSTEPWEQDPGDPYVQSFLNTAEKTLGRKPDLVGITGALDCRFTQYYGKPGIGFGPTGANMHGADEYVDLDSVIEVTKTLANHIVNWTNELKK